MICGELENLRLRACNIGRRLQEQRHKARAFAAQAAPALPHPSDYETYLERKLHGAALEIERHIGRHHCTQ